MYKLVVLLVILLSGFNSAASAELTNQSPLVTLSQQQLVAEKTRSDLLVKKLQGLQNEQKTTLPVINQQVLDHLNLMIAIAKADLDSINLSLKTTQQSTDLIQDSIRNTPDQWETSTRIGIPVNQAIQQQQEKLQQILQERRYLFNLQQKRIKALQKSRDTLQQTIRFVEEWHRDLQRNYQLQQQTSRQESLDMLAVRLQQEQQKWMQRLNQWSEMLQKAQTTGFINNYAYDQIEFNIFEAEEKNNLLETELNTAKISNKLKDLATVFNQKLSLSTLSNLQHQIENVSEQIQTSNSLLQNKLKFLKNYIALINKDLQERGGPDFAHEQVRLAPLKEIMLGYQNLFLTMKQLEKEAATQQILIAKQLKLQLANRQGLPGWSLNAWFGLGQTIVQIPTLTIDKLVGLYEPVINKLELVSSWQWLVVLLGALIWFATWLKLRRFLAVDRVRLQQRSRGFFSAQTVIVVLQLLQRHLSGIMLLAGLIGLLFLLNIPIKLFFFFFFMGEVCLIFIIVI